MIGISLEIPDGWDEEDFDYLMEKLGYVLARDLPSVAYEIEEVEK
jgi:hypothetical protein